jgi:hypothetical protein
MLKYSINHGNVFPWAPILEFSVLLPTAVNQLCAPVAILSTLTKTDLSQQLRSDCVVSKPSETLPFRFRKMPLIDWVSRPLWEEVGAFSGEQSLSERDARALEIYDHAQHLILTHLRRMKLASSLSPSPCNSFLIIQEWWNYSNKEDEWFVKDTDWLKVILRLLRLGPVLDRVPPIVIDMLFQAGPNVPKVSTYRLEIVRLFQMEFDPDDKDDAKFLEFQQRHRECTAFYVCLDTENYISL